MKCEVSVAIELATRWNKLLMASLTNGKSSSKHPNRQVHWNRRWSGGTNGNLRDLSPNAPRISSRNACRFMYVGRREDDGRQS
jgi:hypothetical protein